MKKKKKKKINKVKLKEVVYMDDEGKIVTEIITEKEFDARFEEARERFRRYVTGRE